MVVYGEGGFCRYCSVLKMDSVKLLMHPGFVLWRRIWEYYFPLTGHHLGLLTQALLFQDL